MPAKRSRDTKLIPAIELRTNLATNLEQARRKAGVTQRQLETLTSISKDYISQIENKNANISIDVLNTLAYHLGVSPLSLLAPPRTRKF